MPLGENSPLKEIDLKASYEPVVTGRLSQENLLCGSRIPPLSGREVATVRPLDTVFAGGTVGVGYSSTAVGPKRVVEAVVRSRLAGGASALQESRVELRGVPWESESTGDDGASSEKRSEGDHVDDSDGGGGGSGWSTTGAAVRVPRSPLFCPG